MKSILKKRSNVIMLFCFFSDCISYADRTNLSVAIISMAKEFKWDSTFIGIVFSVFSIGYSSSQIVGSMIAEKIVITRFLIGMLEGPSFPCVHSLSGVYFTKKQRSFAVSFINSGQSIGIILAFFFSSIIVEYFSYQWVFIFFGFPGLLYVFLGYFFLFDSPEKDPFISEEEKNEILQDYEEDINYQKLNEQQEEMENIQEEIENKDLKLNLQEEGEDKENLLQVQITKKEKKKEIKNSLLFWKFMIKQKPFWAILIAHFVHNFGWVLLTTWTPTYLKDIGFTNSTFFTNSIPFIFRFGGVLLAGFFANFLQNKISLTSLRKLMQLLAGFLPMLSFFVLIFSSSYQLSFVFIVIGVFGTSFSACGFWANLIDLSPKRAAILMGVSNTIASIPGALSGIIVGLILDYTNRNWSWVFLSTIIGYIIGLVFYLSWAKGEVLWID